MNKTELKEKILKANSEYRLGNSIMSDSEYDELVEEFKSNFPDEYDEFRDSLNEGSIESGKKLKHKYIMGSLNKIKNSDESTLEKFIKNYVSNFLNVSAKVDGISSVARYVNGKLVEFASRGNGYEGVDFFDKAPYINYLPQTIDFKDELYVRGELVILNNVEIESSTNKRNICAGYMNSKYWNKEDIQKISFIPYTILGDTYNKDEQFKLLEKLGFNVVWYIDVDLKQYDNTSSLNTYLTSCAKQNHLYACDGLVLTDSKAINELDEYRPKNAMAYKINELQAITKIIDVDWNSVSKDGFIIPVFILEPVELGGSIISRASAANLDVIEKLGAKYGSDVLLTKANDIIPHVEKVINNKDEQKLNDTDLPGICQSCCDIELPTLCPCCGSELVRDGVNLRCTSKFCQAQILQQLAFFIKKLGIKSASVATLKNFGIYSYDKLLEFKPNKSYKSQAKLYNELLDKMFTVSKETLLKATNFCGLAEKQLDKIISFYGYDTLLDLAKNVSFYKDAFAEKINELISKVGYPSGIYELTMSKFLDYILDNIKIVNKIISDYRYNALETTQKATKTNKNNMSVCFTGKLNTMSRSEASKLAENNGFEVKDGVTKNLTYLITNDKNSGSSKNKKAQQFGVKILSEEDFLNLLNSNQTTDVLNL